MRKSVYLQIKMYGVYTNINSFYCFLSNISATTCPIKVELENNVHVPRETSVLLVNVPRETSVLLVNVKSRIICRGAQIYKM